MFNRLKITPFLLLVLFSACSYPPLDVEDHISSDYTYIIGPGDRIDIDVWGNPDVSVSVPVRPDGKITVPLVEDVQASGKTAYELARKMEEEYSAFIREPQIVVMVQAFQGVDDQQIRVVGQISGGGSRGNQGGVGGGVSGGSGGARAVGGIRGGGGGGSNVGRYSGTSIPYERGMTLLDVIIKLGTIGQYADGNRASIIRKIGGETKQFGVRMDDLVEDANMDLNVKMMPGDILVIPEAYF